MVIPDNFAQVNLKFTGADLPTGAEVTFGFNITAFTEPPSVLANDVALAWDDSSMNQTMCGAVKLSSVLAKYGPNDTGPFEEVVVDIPGAGANPGVPANTSLLIKKVTMFGGRRGRGRAFIPGVPANQIDPSGAVHSGFATTIQDNLNDFLAAVSGGGHPMALLHSEAVSSDDDPYEVIALNLATKVASQRRRLRR